MTSAVRLLALLGAAAAEPVVEASREESGGVRAIERGVSIASFLMVETR